MLVIQRSAECDEESPGTAPYSTKQSENVRYSLPAKTSSVTPR